MTLHMDITDGQCWNQTVMFFTTEDEEALNSQQKQDLELTMAQIMNFSLQNLGLNWKKQVQKTTKPFR